MLMKMKVLVHPQLGLLCGAALPGAFFLGKTFLLSKKKIVYNLFNIVCQNGPKLLLTRATTIKTGILTPVEFWWVP